MSPKYFLGARRSVKQCRDHPSTLGMELADLKMTPTELALQLKVEITLRTMALTENKAADCHPHL